MLCGGIHQNKIKHLGLHASDNKVFVYGKKYARAVQA